MTDNQTISWMALDEGTDVVSADGESLGKVTKVVADVQKDIFSGVVFRPGVLGTQRFAPADVVAEITPEGVHLSISSEEAEKLEEYSG
jgi:hypothetical protein